jgi:hypothetical protein
VSVKLWGANHGYCNDAGIRNHGIIGIASLIAWPSAWFYMKNWLTNFAFRIQLDPLVFIFATLAVIIISIVTIFWQVLRHLHESG